MSEEQPVQGHAMSDARKPHRRVAFSLFIVIVAISLFAVAFWYVGGVEYVSGLLGGNAGQPAVAAPAKLATSVVATTTASASGLKLPAGVDQDLARRMYVEQIESSANLTKMARGDVSKFVISRVDATDTSATVSLTALFKDNTSAPGMMYLVKRSGSWYFMAIGGMNPPDASGLAAGVAVGNNSENAETNSADIAQMMSKSGVTTFDTDIINAILSQQAANQALLKDVVGGTFTTFEMGTPVQGVGTTKVPVKLSGKTGSSAGGEFVLIAKKIDSHDFTFLTTFRKQ